MLNNTLFANRLKKVMDFYTISAAAFAETIEVPRSSISHILSGRNKPSLDFVLKTIDAYQEVDLYWLLKGVGHFPKTTSSLPYTKETPVKKATEYKVEKKPASEPQAISLASDSAIEKVLVFYKDGTFKEYKNRD